MAGVNAPRVKQAGKEEAMTPAPITLAALRALPEREIRARIEKSNAKIDRLLKQPETSPLIARYRRLTHERLLLTVALRSRLEEVSRADVG